MTLAEQREKLEDVVGQLLFENFTKNAHSAHWSVQVPQTIKFWREEAAKLIAALSAAGFSIVADGAFDAFELAKVDLARKP